MLVELRVQGYAVIEDVTLVLGPGLSALTGETGAGKSIVVDALSLLLGERASSEVVRAGAERAVVEGVFDVGNVPDMLARLGELGLEPDDGLLLLKREVQAEGRNRAWVNGSPATAATVGELGSALVDLHGQHEHQALLGSGEQRRILDAFGGSADEAAEVAERHRALTALEAEVAAREERRRELQAREDFLRFQLGEIEGAELAEDEETALEEEAGRLEHARELAEGTLRVHQALYGEEPSLSDGLAEARSVLDRLARYDGSLGEPARLLEEAYHQVVDVGRRMADYAEAVEHDPRRLEAVRRRQDLLFRFKRKYGPTLPDVIATGRRVRAELDELDRAGTEADDLRERVGAERDALVAAAGRLSARRRAAAERLAAEVRGVLPSLGMEGARFEVRLSPHAHVGAGGAESVELLCSLNPGFEPRPLARIASGGELSRVMLALKAILARVDRVPTLVFDEIDAGVGGVVATAVAANLREVAAHHQVFVVTHLPQLASRAHAHLRVEKSLEAGVAVTRVRALEGEERVREVARMLGGDPDSKRSREHARELLAAR